MRDILLLLVFCLSGTQAQGESERAHQGLQTSGQTSKDVWDELRALRDIVVELTYTKAELQTQRDKAGLADLEKENGGSKFSTCVMLGLWLQVQLMKIIIVFLIFQVIYCFVKMSLLYSKRH